MPTALKLGLSLSSTSATTSGASLWTPGQFGSDLKFWYSNSGNTITAGKVEELIDLSSNGHDLTAANANARPTQNAGFISFDGDDDVLQRAGINVAIPTAVTIFALFKAGTYDAGENLGHNYFFTSNSINYALLRTSATATRVTADSVLDTGYPIANDETFLFSYTVKLGADNALVYKNAELETTATETSLPNLTEFRFGGRTQSLRIGQFDFYEFFLVAADLSVADRQRSEGYICHNNDLASLLPVGHPYKNSAPV